MSVPENQLKSLLTAPTWFELPNYPIYSVQGEDRLRYLHGRITQDVKGLPDGQIAESLLLSPQGKIQGHFSLLRRADDLLLISDPLPSSEIREEFEHNLLLFKVADDVTLQNLSTELCKVSIRGADSNQLLELVGVDSPPGKDQSGEAVISGSSVLVSSAYTNVADQNAYDLILPHDLVAQLRTQISADSRFLIGDQSQYETVRILSFQPRFPNDINDSVSAPEIGVEKKISFSKGCYTGQEVVEMTIARGRPNKRLVLLHLLSENPVATDQAVLIDTIDNEPKKCGYLSSCCKSPWDNTHYCLGFLKASAGTDSKLSVADARVEIVRESNTPAESGQ